jgi:DNA/RNA endonuclease YhcR with UshA esterase domain
MYLLKKNFPLLSLTALLLTVGFTACVKKDFDEPPVGGDPVTITANTTIADLKALHVTSSGFDQIADDLIIEGIVVMDDRSGNYYKTLVIQDASGGIEVKFNDASLYNQFPVGRKIFIKCQDLILTDYNNLTQLTGSTVEQGGQVDDVGLTEVQVRKKVVKGPVGTSAPVPTVVTIDQLKQGSSNYISTLIKLENVQFSSPDADKTYADPVTQFSLNRIIEDCSKGQILLRSSGFSDFAGELTPTGNGTITGVLGIFGNTLQLYIRDLNDVDMRGDRCTGVGGELMTIGELRTKYTGSTTTAPGNRKIKGIIISDRVANNITGKNLVLQDGTAGIVVRFSANHSYNLGQEIEVEVSNQELSEFNGLLQVNNISLDKSGVLFGSSNTITPRTATIAEINANSEAWESTLVKILGATISGGGTPISGGKTVTDATGSIPMYTQTYAAFANMATPTGPVTLTAIVSDFNGKQIAVRNPSDMQP